MRKFPVGPALPKQKYANIPTNADGTPKRESNAWKTLLANAAARDPADRSPAERSALARENGSEAADLGRLQSAYALGERAAANGLTENPFTTEQFKNMWEAGRNAALRYAR